MNASLISIDHFREMEKPDRSVREMRSLIMGLEDAMRKIPGHLTAEHFKTTHHFEPGIYIRELFIPKETILTGRIHNHAHLNILSQGRIKVWTEDGMKILSASTTIKSKPGIKRVGYSYEDTVWITVHSNPTDERDIEKVEKRLFSDSFEEAYLSSNRTFEDAGHFLGFSPEEIDAMSQNQADQIDFPLWPSLIRINRSSVHGLGVFASRCIDKSTVIAPARIHGKRTPVGRYCNHSGVPNGQMEVQKNGDIYLVASENIDAGSEIFNDYYLSFENSNQKEKLCLL